MEYELTVAGLKRRLPICRVDEDLAIAAFVIFGDPELTTAAAKALLARAPAHDALITAESKGIPLVHEMARLEGNRRYFLARKSQKLYLRNPLHVTVKSITTAQEQTLYLDGDDAARMEGKRIVIVDDVISTGASLRALEALIAAAGGTVCGRMAILAEGEAQTREDVIFLEKLPLFHPDGTIKTT